MGLRWDVLVSHGSSEQGGYRGGTDRVGDYCSPDPLGKAFPWGMALIHRCGFSYLMAREPGL